MNIQLNAPKHLISCATAGHIVSVDVNVWTATKQDRGISNEVTTAKNASADAGRFTKNLLSNSSEHKALLNYRQSVYNWLQRMTYDWAGAMRLLPIINLERFKREYEGHEREFKRLLEAFILAYPGLISDAAFKQGDMFNISEYPSPQDVRNKFRINLFLTQVPANDFRAGGVAQALADDLKLHYEKQVTDIIDNVMRDASQRLVEIASRLSNSCTEVVNEEDGKVRRKRIFDSTLTHAREICETLKHFNLTGSTILSDAVSELEEAIDDVSIEDLRESSLTRSIVKESVDAMLNKFAPLKTPDPITASSQPEPIIEAEEENEEDFPSFAPLKSSFV